MYDIDENMDELDEFDREEQKLEMLQSLRDYDMGFGEDLDEESDYEDVRTAWKEMQDALESVEDAMYPNGRDWDSENYDD